VAKLADIGRGQRDRCGGPGEPLAKRIGPGLTRVVGWRCYSCRSFNNSLAWLARFRRLAIRYERREDIHQALLDLGCALICFHRLQEAVQ